MTEQPKATAPLRLDDLAPELRRRLIAGAFFTGASLVAAVLVVYYSLPWEGGPADVVWLRILVGFGALVLALLVAIQFVLHAKFPMLRLFEVLAGAITLAITLFASMYAYLSYTDPASFSEPLTRTDALYFAVTTATTVGFGDITAVSQLARVVVMMQMVVNVAVVGIAARSLVYAARKRVDGR